MTEELHRLTSALGHRYRIERELGQGGMATVYLAEDLKLNRPVAIKVLLPDLAGTLGPLRFQREIGIIAQLRHPNILGIHDSGEAEDLLYYVMPFVEGRTLRDRLAREKQLPLEDALRIAREVSAALSYAHDRDLVHRDIKPANILLENGRALVSDFGVARAIDEAGGADLTRTGMAVGTPTYMSPEQAAGAGDLDGRSDIYSLGCVVYEMLAGQPPFMGRAPINLVAQHITSTPQPITTFRSTVPPETVAAIERALAKSPADRFATAAEFGQALSAKSSTPPEGLSARAPTRRRFAIVGAIALALGAAAVLGTTLSQRKATDVPTQIATERGLLSASPRLAVLPFETVGRDSTDEYLTRGLFVEVSNRLTSELHGVIVRGPESTLRFQGASISMADLGAALSVDYVLAASVQLSDDHVRLLGRLIDISNDAQIWTGSFQGEVASGTLFQLQDSIARAVALALEVELDSSSPARTPTSDLAYTLYLRGAGEALTHTQRGNQTAEILLKEAIALDPDFTRAHAKLGWVFGFRSQLLGGGREAADSALIHADRTLLLDSTEAEGWLALGMARQNQGLYSSALQAHEQALALSPTLVESRNEASFIAYLLGRFDVAAEHQAALLSIDPDHHFTVGSAGALLGLIGRYAEAERWVQAALTQFPEDPAVRAYAILVLIAQGRWEPARASLDAWIQAAPSSPFPYSVGAAAALQEGDLPRALRLAEASRLIAPTYRGYVGLTGNSVLGHVLTQLGEPEKGRPLLIDAISEGEALVMRGDERPGVRFDIASSYASLGNVERALEWLDRAYEAGWRLNRWIPQGISTFSLLEMDPRFQEWVRRVDVDVAAQAERISYDGVHPTALRERF